MVFYSLGKLPPANSGLRNSIGSALNLRAHASRAFTLVEVLVATALLGTLASSAIWSLAQANNYATIARLNTGAQVAAQNEIDLIMSKGPFNPQHKDTGVAAPQIPAELTLGTHAAKSVIIYTEPASASNKWAPLVVTGQLVTTVTDTGVIVKGQNLNLYSAKVIVTYNFRGRKDKTTGLPYNYTVQLNAVRASDTEASF